MKHCCLRCLSALCVFLALPQASAADAWLTLEPTIESPNNDRHVVLISGDEEYRSEEALPQLAKMLTQQHGFKCTVLFAIHPVTGEIYPDVRNNIPGLEVLADADLMIIATRFRDLPDDQMVHIVNYLESGKPVLGMRTATHAFKIDSSETYKRYTWDYDGEEFTQGFGRQVLGETWIRHHGRHGSESTGGFIAPDAKDHAIARGINDRDIWGATDVYAVRLPLPENRTPIILGANLNGMSPDSPLQDDARNDPMMPVAWTGDYAIDDGPTGRVFTTTLGAATDLTALGTRRLLINATYWCLGLEEQIPAGGCSADVVGRYHPTKFGFGGFRRGMTPADHAMNTETEDDDVVRVVICGNTFSERMAQSGMFDALAHAARPDEKLSIRHIPWSADEVALRPREHSVPRMRHWIDRLDTDELILCFGMSESFAGAAGLDSFRNNLARLIEDLRTGPNTASKLTFVTPIAHEDLGAPWPTGAAVAEHNAFIASYVQVMKEVCATLDVACIDLFQLNTTGNMTTNGIHPNTRGCKMFANEMIQQMDWVDAQSLVERTTTTSDATQFRQLACDMYWLFRGRYRATNSEYVWGRRHAPFGVVNFPPEMRQIERMLSARDQHIWDSPRPAINDILALEETSIWETLPSQRRFPEDDWTPDPVEAKGTETSLGSTDIKSPDEFVDSFTLPEGYVIECFVSEEDFPELRNPVALTFDETGRLWVLCAGGYPHLLPGDRPECQLLILEDTDNDGRADKRTVYADELEMPTGFIIDRDTVYIGLAPDLLMFKDVDGDDVADTREVVASGFGMPDSHHQISAFEWEPNGGFMLHEGVFTKSNIETPWGTLRTNDAAAWRFDPRTQRMQLLSHCGFSNPWGHVFDDYGQSILADASGGANYTFAHVISASTYPRKPGRPGQFLNRGRPTAGCELISSRHFPEDVQESFLVNQSIGFHGTRWDRIIEDGSTLKAERMPLDLITCSDTNFRPVAMEIGPDGALYVVDWCNPIIGHMQYSVRDPRRDKTHGRIWRVRHADRPLLTQPEIARASVAQLLELLRLPERNTRQHARRRLQRMNSRVVLPAVQNWMARLDVADALYGRLMLEGLWIHQALGVFDLDLVSRVMDLDEPRSRAGAVRVLRHWLQNGDVAATQVHAHLQRAAEDDDIRVRLEAAVTTGFIEAADSGPILVAVAGREMDGPMETVLNQTMIHLGLDGDSGSAVLRRFNLERVDAAELLALEMDDDVATAMLVRSDIPMATRNAAVTHLATSTAVEPMTMLITQLNRARRDNVAHAIGRLLLQQDTSSVGPSVAQLNQLAASGRDGQRAAAIATLIHAKQFDDSDKPVAADDLFSALEIMDDVPPAHMRQRIEALTQMPGVDALRGARLVRMLQQDDAVSVPWMVERANDAATTPFSKWGPDHELAMAALKVISESTADGQWPEEAAAYKSLASNNEQIERGKAVYMDAAVGCVRCHGADGTGLEGFPPLDRSRYALGDPRRSAAIVLWGLYGEVRMMNGERFNSAMEPLGASLDDQQIADALTYVRQSWGNFAAPVTVADVAAVRSTPPTGGSIWSVKALLKAFPFAEDTLIGALPDKVAVADDRDDDGDSSKTVASDNETAAPVTTPSNGADTGATGSGTGTTPQPPGNTRSRINSIVLVMAGLAVVAILVFIMRRGGT